ncbi:MAG TPA: 23S rRNA (adenine(2503)-C(2))-methyltransferase RlmN [Gammaproteobacteria bacterium]|nr:23S rRNA (adenine(2503)-C(2))-methyltransferase RlmN [Gammaproteobacteria bacterium]
MSANALIIAAPPAKPNLLGLSGEELASFVESIGQRPYRARQLMHWMHRRHVLAFEAMTDLSLDLRTELESIASIETPTLLRREQSDDGTIKWLLDVGGGQAIETVMIPEPKRTTLCISSQAGCALDCAFCATGQQGFNRNLSAAEILGQVAFASAAIAPLEISNVVFMGMGEPLANYRNVVAVTRLLIDDHAYGLSRRRVTISTAGLVPQIRRLADDCNVALAVSLHAPTDDLRDELVPINRRHPIAELLDACWRYADVLASRQITFEYVMLDGVNDSVSQARTLIGLLRNRPAKVNLIPFNSFEGGRFRCSKQEMMDAFWQTLNAAGIVATIRRPRGDDIAAACGQLAGRVDDRRRIRLSDKLSGVTSS